VFQEEAPMTSGLTHTSFISSHKYQQ